MMQHSVLHSTTGKPSEFGNSVPQRGVVCLVQDETTGKVEQVRVGDGVTQFDDLARLNFTAAPV